MSFFLPLFTSFHFLSFSRDHILHTLIPERCRCFLDLAHSKIQVTWSSGSAGMGRSSGLTCSIGKEPTQKGRERSKTVVNVDVHKPTFLSGAYSVRGIAKHLHAFFPLILTTALWGVNTRHHPLDRWGNWDWEVWKHTVSQVLPSLKPLLRLVAKLAAPNHHSLLS